MLKLTDDGAHITLQGKSAGKGGGLFWFGFALLVGAIGVAMAMSLLPERLAIGALALLIIGSFVFNKMRSQQSNAESAHISTGVLQITQGGFVHEGYGTQQRIILASDDSISVDAGNGNTNAVKTNAAKLLIKSADGTVKCQVTGFDSVKEAQVMQAVLQGQKFGKRHANIKMQSN